MHTVTRRLTACLLLASSMFLTGAGFAQGSAVPPAEEGANQDEVIFPSAQLDWESWHVNYLRQQGLITRNPEGEAVTAAQLNALLNEVARQIARAYGQTENSFHPYFSGENTGYPYMKAGIAAFQAHCESFDEWATTPNYFLEQQKRTDEDERDICLNDVLEFAAILHKTECYIAQFDPGWYAIRGVDYLSDFFEPTRIGKSLDEIDNQVDYDFAELAMATADLTNVDRRRALSAIFKLVTLEANSDLDRHLAVLQFLGQAAFHNSIQPLQEDSRMVVDPLILLELGEMSCGQVARVACDLFSAGGYPSRLVQAGGHVLAEVYYDQGWHYLDADANVISPAMVDGRIPSMVELSQTPGLVDTTGDWWMVSEGDTSMDGPAAGYKSYAYFAREAYTTQPLYMFKTANPFGELNGFYGWDDLTYVDDPNRQLYDDFPAYSTPTAPAPTAIAYDTDTQAYILQWEPSTVASGTLAGYRVYVSEESRGWDWNTFYGDASLLRYRAGDGYHPEDQAKEGLPLPCGVALIELGPTATSVSIPIRPGQALYVSLVAYDAHGQQVGNQLYPPSTEFLLAA